jgi:hypothetical protein
MNVTCSMEIRPCSHVILTVTPEGRPSHKIVTTKDELKDEPDPDTARELFLHFFRSWVRSEGFTTPAQVKAALETKVFVL